MVLRKAKAWVFYRACNAEAVAWTAEARNSNLGPSSPSFDSIVKQIGKCKRQTFLESLTDHHVLDKILTTSCFLLLEDIPKLISRFHIYSYIYMSWRIWWLSWKIPRQSQSRLLIFQDVYTPAVYTRRRPFCAEERPIIFFVEKKTSNMALTFHVRQRGGENKQV